ncbi:MAG: homoserine O-acetyltransferase [Lentisphaeria bacterium]|nr:homoserine O-acetyltransferase [Lentisphaeria bacterium]
MEKPTFSSKTFHAAAPQGSFGDVSGGGQRLRKEYDSPDNLKSAGWVQPRRLRLVTPDDPLPLDCGITFGPIDVEYEMIGELAGDRNNVILITHALSGDAHVAGWDATASPTWRPWRLDRPGWWDSVIGPGKAIDTHRFCVLCVNILGSCYGTTGPSSINPATGRPYGQTFPAVTVGDSVRLQARLLDHLGIKQLYAVCGGSLGGLQAFEWAVAYPERVVKCIILAAGPRLSAQGVGFHVVGRHAILADAKFNNGDYYDQAKPDDGLAAARMLAHITYLSGQGMEDKFGRRRTRPANRGNVTNSDDQFEVESYLKHQGQSFVARFDANSYLYITQMLDNYDGTQWGDGDLKAACARIRAEVMVVSFSSDWLYPPECCREFVTALLHNRIPATYMQVESNYGHDAFLVEAKTVGRILRAFLLSPTLARRQFLRGGQHQ